MNCILRRAFVFILVVVLCGTYFGCTSSNKRASKKDSSPKEHQHGEGGHCH